MAQWLRTLAALPEDMGSIPPSAHILPQVPGMVVVHSHTGRQNIYTYLKNKQTKEKETVDRKAGRSQG